MTRTPRSIRAVTSPMDGSMLLILRGELDFANIDELERQLDGVGDEELHIDLGEVEFLDCAALGVIIGVTKRTRDAGLPVVVHRPSPIVRRMIDITGFDALVDIT